MDNIKGMVFNIQRFTIHDGPGIRTEIFLKGCTLRCAWCGNPESFTKKPQIGVYPTQCIGVSKCGDCITVCPKGGKDVFTIENDKIISINRTICDDCLLCFNECPSDALKLWGKEMTVDEVMKVVLADKSYYEENNGGVTISGGESLVQPEFVKNVFMRCNEEGVHTCLESALHVSESVMDSVMPYTDMVITDIKHINSDVHKKFVGAGNEQVLSNIKKLVTYDKPVVLRIPIIPGFNDNEKDISDIGDFIVNELDNKVVQLQLLRFRPLGEEKYKSLSIPYKMEVTKERTDFEDEIRTYVEILKNKGIKAFAGSTNKIDI